MPRLAREALGIDGSNQQASGSGAWAPTQPATADWNHAPNDRIAAEDRQNRLTRTLENDIIPRLVKVHRAVPAAPAPDEGALAPPTARDVEKFVQLVLAREHVPAQAFIELLVQNGVSVETIYLDLLAPAAQHLNYLWTQDLCEFTQVTLGLAHLQRLTHELSPGMAGERRYRGNARRVLLVPARGEQQTFGLSMVAEFFHHAGWDVECGGASSQLDAVDIVRTEWFDILGLSAGSESRLDSLRGCVREVRGASRNKRIGVLVGGPIFAGHPERVKFVGADASGLDGKQAPAHADRLMALRAQSH
ncbi:cobalamin B12-binding domain-containing protein [Variovorax sp. GT1P44]|uniref:cobalamin B12-binding domain-containing protein n=1 Tax=Variovorax sp. GT1P44 TaxID=3443742 RepID=UPI003F466D3C